MTAVAVSPAVDAMVALHELPLVCTDADLQQLLQVSRSTFFELKRAGLLPTRLRVTSARQARYSRVAVLGWLQAGGAVRRSHARARV